LDEEGQGQEDKEEEEEDQKDLTLPSKLRRSIASWHWVFIAL
jgi:hypothetical protein